MTIDDNELRRRFAQMREAEREGAPGFAQTLGRARARRNARTTWRVRPVVLGAAAAVVVAALWLASSRPDQPSAVAPAIGSWRAPTDALLQTPGSDLLGAMPALGASVLDAMIPTTSEQGA
jgi:hypothetical protein